MENEERTTGTRAAMGREGIDALVVRLPENLVLLSGHWSLCGDAYLVFPREGEAICVLPDTQETEASQELWSASCLCYRHGTIDSKDQAEEVAVRLAELQRKNRWKRIGAEL
jgi:Xaa-Pro aminopeptidase